MIHHHRPECLVEEKKRITLFKVMVTQWRVKMSISSKLANILSPDLLCSNISHVHEKYVVGTFALFCQKQNVILKEFMSRGYFHLFQGANSTVRWRWCTVVIVTMYELLPTGTEAMGQAATEGAGCKERVPHRMSYGEEHSQPGKQCSGGCFCVPRQCEWPQLIFFFLLLYTR